MFGGLIFGFVAGFAVFAVVCVAIALALVPVALSSVRLWQKMHRDGHGWVTHRIAFRLRTNIGPDAFRIPRMEEVGVLPDFDSDPADYLVRLMRREPPYTRMYEFPAEARERMS